MSETKVKGTITEQHLDEVRKIGGCFDEKVVRRLEQAREGDTFLNIVFADWRETKQSK
jgi:hypothetical protein